MKLLAIDSSSMPASVAVLEEDILLAEFTIRHQKTHSQILLPMLEQVRRMLELDLEQVDAIAVAGGPGSFTGLRIGSATAKGIALAQGKPIVSVPTLEGMACSLAGSSALVCPMLDARRQQVFAGIYSFENEGDESAIANIEANPGAHAGAKAHSETGTDPLRVWMDQTPIDVKELCARLNTLSAEQDRRVILLGDGVIAYRELIRENLKVPCELAPPHLMEQRASSVAVRARTLLSLGRAQEGAMHRPEYLRVSQAERVRAQKQEKQ